MTNIEDKFNRANYVEFIFDLIKNCKDYKRQDDKNSYIIAIDSAWGTGKTTLVGFLEKKLAEQKDTEVVVYNAWDNDYFDNAFEPLFYSIIKSDVFNDVKNDENLLVLTNSVLNIMGAAVKDIAETAHAQNTVRAIHGTFTSLLDCLDQNVPASAAFMKRKEAFDKFGTALKNTTKWFKNSDNKLVIIIDELDRCKPLFAIRTLEIAKHFFNIDNVVFVFALDIRQLSSSIKCVYGQDMDTTGYLCRFFDYITQMPAVDILDYIKTELMEFDLLPQIEVTDLKAKYGTITFSVAISRFIKEVSITFNLSLREVDTVLQNYKIMLNTVLLKHENIGEHYIYLFYLVMKYKRPDIFAYLFIDRHKSNKSELITEINRLSSVIEKNPFINSAGENVKSKNTLQEKTWNPFCDERGETQYYSAKIIDVKERISLKRTSLEGMPSVYSEKLPDENVQSFSNVLFRSDLEKWDEIKDLTYAEYLHRQLENYNFSTSLDDGIVRENVNEKRE